jgi:hypothetical protein
MTDAGFALETRVRADETKMQFTRAAISTDDHFSDTDDALAKLTELYNIQQDGKVTAVQVINTTTVYVQVDVNQAESKADYQMRSAALYAKDDDGTEVLYGVTVLQDPVFVHKDADGSYLGFGINTTVGKASNVVVVVDPANMVTQQVFEGTMKNYYTKAEVDAKFVTDDDFASKLPKNIATTDAANTFAKSQTLAGGATDGKGNAYATTKDVTTGLNNGLSTKVTDNKNGTEQLNGVQVQPFNKLSDTIGGRNLLINTAQLNDSTVCLDRKSNISDTYLGLNIYQTNTQWDGMKIYWSYLAPKIKTNTNYVLSEYVRNTSPTASANIRVYGTEGGVVPNSTWGLVATLPPNSGWTRISVPANIASFPTTLTTLSKLRFENATILTDGYVQFAGLKFEQGSIATDWTPAPEDEVTDNHDGTITANNAIYDLSKTGITPLGFVNSSSFNDLPLGTVLSGVSMTDGPDKTHIFTTTTFCFNGWKDTVRKAQIAIADSENLMYFRVYMGIHWTDWTLLANDSDTVHTTDMRKPASNVAGIEEVNAKQDKIGYTPANAANVVDRNPDTGVVSEPVDFTKLTVNGGKSVATINNVFKYINEADESTALNNSKNDSNLHYVEE